MYIVFEGIVGTGKTTQSKLLVEKLKKTYPDTEILRVREPGSTEITDAIRTLVQGTQFNEEMDPICEAYLYSASRAQSLNTIVFQALERGAIVVSDRSFITSLAYQGYAMTGDTELIWTINQPIVQSHLPDLLLYFNMDIAKGLARTFDGEGDKHELKGIEFFHKVEEGYKHSIQDSRFAKLAKIIDASGTIEEVEESVRQVVMDYTGGIMNG